MENEFKIGGIIKITCLNVLDEYAIVISEDHFREVSGYSGERYESGSIFYQKSEKEVKACNATFLRVAKHIEKSSLEEAVSGLKEQIPQLKEKLQSTQNSLEFFKQKT